MLLAQWLKDYYRAWRIWKLADVWRPSKRPHYWRRPEYWEESWRLKEICCHTNSNGKLSAKHIYQPLRSGRIWHKVNFKAEFNRFDFRVFLLLDWLPSQGWRTSLPYYLPIAGGRIIGFIPFPRVLVLCEMQSVSFRIWTRVAVSISYQLTLVWKTLKGVN